MYMPRCGSACKFGMRPATTDYASNCQSQVSVASWLIEAHTVLENLGVKLVPAEEADIGLKAKLNKKI